MSGNVLRRANEHLKSREKVIMAEQLAIQIQDRAPQAGESSGELYSGIKKWSQGELEREQKRRDAYKLQALLEAQELERRGYIELSEVQKYEGLILDWLQDPRPVTFTDEHTGRKVSASRHDAEIHKMTRPMTPVKMPPIDESYDEQDAAVAAQLDLLIPAYVRMGKLKADKAATALDACVRRQRHIRITGGLVDLESTLTDYANGKRW